MSVIIENLKNADSELLTQKKEKKEEILAVPLDKLKLNPNRVRRQINREEIYSMAKNIKLFGVLQPLEINRKNEVVLGNRRFEAAKLASLNNISCIVRESSDTIEIEKQLVSDLHTKHLTVWERAMAFKKLIELKGITKYSLANYLEISHNLVCRTLAILEANENTLNLMKEGKISQKKVAMVLYRLKDKSLENFVVNEIIEKGMNIVQAGNFIAEINDPDIFKKHFMQRIKGFKTSLKNFKEKLKLLNLTEMQKKEIIKELRSVDIKGIFKE